MKSNSLSSSGLVMNEVSTNTEGMYDFNTTAAACRYFGMQMMDRRNMLDCSASPKVRLSFDGFGLFQPVVSSANSDLS